MGNRKGIKGQVKEHRKHDGGTALAIPAQKRGRKRVDEGPLVLHACTVCQGDVLAPEKVKRVGCGVCAARRAIAHQLKEEAERAEAKQVRVRKRGARKRKPPRRTN